eukprot:TCONS_00010942-protein
MISDINEKIKHSILSSFADDTRLMKSISCAADVSLLQDDLDVVYDWTSINNMELNGKKFEHIAYGKNEQLKVHSVYKSDVQQPVEIKSAVKDLGILLSNNLSYEMHIQTITDRVEGISAWIYRTFKSRDKSVMITLWKTLVLQHLEYC